VKETVYADMTIQGIENFKMYLILDVVYYVSVCDLAYIFDDDVPLVFNATPHRFRRCQADVMSATVIVVSVEKVLVNSV